MVTYDYIGQVPNTLWKDQETDRNNLRWVGVECVGEVD